MTDNGGWLMSLINWSDHKDTIGIEEIDADHMKIIEVMEEIKVAVIDRQSDNEIAHLCNRLISVSRQHFDQEERLMLKYFYPDTEAHIGQHMAYINIIGTLIKNLKEAQYSFAIETLKYLANWFLHHIKDADGHYAKFIAEKIA